MSVSNEFLLMLNILSGVFMASAIEAIETATQVICVARCISKKAALTGLLLAVGVLAGLTATLGMTIIYFVPIQLFHFIFGVFALLVGLRWFRDGVLRYSGWLALRDEAALYEQSQAQLGAACSSSNSNSSPNSNPNPSSVSVSALGKAGKVSRGKFWFGVVATFKPAFIEGLETVYLVLVLGYPYGLVGEAAATATAAYFLVGLVAFALFSGPLKAVPINFLKGLVGLQMTVLGTMWTGTALGVVWWRENISYFLVLVVYALVALVLTRLLKRNRARYLTWHAAQNGKLSRYSRMGMQTLLLDQAQAQTAPANPDRPKLTAGLATLNRLFFGDGVILVGLPVVVYFTWQASSVLANASWLIVVLPPLGLVFIAGLSGVLGLASWQFSANEKHKENRLLLSPELPLIKAEIEAAQ